MNKTSKKQRHLVLPIKDENILKQVQSSLLNDFRLGIRNYTIFRVGVTTLLRVSDVLKLTYDDVFNSDGSVKTDTYIKDKKTRKGNTIILKYSSNDLQKYKEWLFSYLKKHNYYQQWIDGGKWLFISSRNPTNHLEGKPFYFAMRKVGNELGINYLGTHTMRKTGAYMMYESSHDIAKVMKALNHSSEATTLRYLGIDREEMESVMDKTFSNF